MARGKEHTAEQIVNLLRQVEVGVANGKLSPFSATSSGAGVLRPWRVRKDLASQHTQATCTGKDKDDEVDRRSQVHRGSGMRSEVRFLRRGKEQKGWS